MDLISPLCVLGLLFGVAVLMRKEEFKVPNEPSLKGRSLQSNRYTKYLRDLNSTCTPRLPVRSGIELYSPPQVIVSQSKPTQAAKPVAQPEEHMIPSRQVEFTPCMSYKLKTVTK